MKHKPKAPGFFLFTQDYFGDVAVRMMPSHLRVFWIEAFFLMSDSPRRGVLLQQNSEPYLPGELAVALNIPVDIVIEATQYVIEKGIASIDRATGALMNRKMYRQAKLSEINAKNGKKGGNPHLKTERVITTKDRVLDDSVNRDDIRGDKPRARAFPSPSPSPTPLGNTNTVENSPIESGAPLKNAGARPRDLASDFFAEKCLALTGAPYVPETADFVVLAKLRKAFGTEPRGQPEGWQQAVENYFASPLSQYSLADLANPKRYAVFRNSPLDGFNKPINHANRNGGGHVRESETQRRARSTSEAADALVRRFDEKVDRRLRSGDE